MLRGGHAAAVDYGFGTPAAQPQAVKTTLANQVFSAGIG
jgi:hypothetical protein